VDRSSEIEEKTERLSSMLAEEGLRGVLLGAQHNFAWLSAGGTNAVDLSREQGACALFVRADGRRFVLASCIEMARVLEEELAGADFEPIEYDWEEEKARPTLLAFAWNPSVTGTKVEETCVASSEGVEVITTSPDWPRIHARVEGREYSSPDVLSF
jgi:hypothetical protein